MTALTIFIMLLHCVIAFAGYLAFEVVYPAAAIPFVATYALTNHSILMNDHLILINNLLYNREEALKVFDKKANKEGKK